MFKYKLTEKKYTPGGFKVGDTKTQKGRKSTVTNVDPVTGTVTWSVEGVAAFDTVFTNFNKLRQLLKTLEVTGDAKDDTTIDSISDNVNDLFNKFRTHLRRNYPDQYEKLSSIGENINEGWMDELRNYVDKFFEDHRLKVPEGQKHLVVYLSDFKEWVKENGVPNKLVKLLLQRISNEEDKGFLIDIEFDPLEEDEGIGYMTPDAFGKIKKDVYTSQYGYKLVPKKIKGAGTIVKQLFEKETLNEFSDFQQKRINQFDELEENLNQIAPLMSNAKSETVKYYNENPGSYAIVYSTDMIEDYISNIIELLKQEEE